MSPALSLRPLLEDESWRAGLVGGVAAVPFTTAAYLRTGSEVTLGPVFVAGLIAGYLVADPPARSRAANRAGVIGALPGLWLVSDGVFFIATGMESGPARMAAVVVLTLFTALLFGLAVAVAAVGARVGGWLRAKTSWLRPAGLAL
ncbi:hypothetical protein C488_10131 [Natrinema pellirubrum DSM 15624]|uniref:Uncharacterized protein n=1 Tax=Natrinema pellirubrum (strain DSM 15624 / CIP 106293 / JCM 10476 / NCIMB 786 / 157) TaxID=797303 RepID=L0JN89_NATP1|nr:DUF5518 domain-containing protein [Natrinema pellirubrum]AGB33000.1 hypothetical protein Natpe_3210 [Natrinema pellirubrum DSM 15624]ELY75104.1 hypothetical protein C488_10131 [Natrinema pellirubrum DSM 15624]